MHSRESVSAGRERGADSAGSAGRLSQSAGEQTPPAQLAEDMADGKQELVSRFLDSLPPQRSVPPPSLPHRSRSENHCLKGHGCHTWHMFAHWL